MKYSLPWPSLIPRKYVNFRGSNLQWKTESSSSPSSSLRVRLGYCYTSRYVYFEWNFETQLLFHRGNIHPDPPRSDSDVIVTPEWYRERGNKCRLEILSRLSLEYPRNIRFDIKTPCRIRRDDQIWVSSLSNERVLCSGSQEFDLNRPNVAYLGLGRGTFLDESAEETKRNETDRCRPLPHQSSFAVSW